MPSEFAHIPVCTYSQDDGNEADLVNFCKMNTTPCTVFLSENIEGQLKIKKNYKCSIPFETLGMHVRQPLFNIDAIISNQDPLMVDKINILPVFLFY